MQERKYQEHLTTDSQTDVARLNCGLPIRCVKNCRNLMNDVHINNCISRFDSGSYRRLQFLRVLVSVGAHTAVSMLPLKTTATPTTLTMMTAALSQTRQPLKS